MSTQVSAHPLILSSEEWVGYVRRRKKGELELYPNIDRVGERLRLTTLETLIEKDETLAQLRSLPPMTQAWRWEPGSAFSQSRLPAGPTYFFRCEARPGPDHPERDRIGWVVVNAWVRVESKAQARAIFQQELKDLCLLPEVCEEPEVHRLTDYEDDPDGLAYFEQAQLDGQVVVSHVCPRYPVYWVTAAIELGSPARPAECHYFLSADSICQEGEDVFDPDFWTGERERTALEAASEAIRGLGWAVTTILAQRPCGREDVPTDLVLAYDEAEESGTCLVSVSEDGPDSEE